MRKVRLLPLEGGWSNQLIGTEDRGTMISRTRRPRITLKVATEIHLYYFITCNCFYTLFGEF